MGTWINSFLESSNTQLENALLSRILVSRKMVPDLLPDYFTGPRRKFYNEIMECWTTFGEIDPVYLKATGFEEQVNVAVQESGSSSQKTITDLHELWQKREIAKVVLMANSSFDNADVATDEVIRNIQEGASRILLRNQNNKYDHHEAVVRLHDSIIEGNLTDRKIMGYSTGIEELDKYTSGIEHFKTYAIGALKKTGKSRFAVGLNTKFREQGANIVWNRLEMAEMQLNLCALANLSGVDSRALRKKLSTEDMLKVQEALTKLDELNWKLIRETTVPNLRAKIIELQNKAPVDIVVVDYIQRMQAKGFNGDRRAQEVEYIAKGLADIAAETGVAMIILSQLSKEAERIPEGEMPNMSFMKESQGLAEAADCIITIHDPNRSNLTYREDGSYIMHEIDVLVEQREGLCGAKFRIMGDHRICKYYNHTDPYGKNGKN